MTEAESFSAKSFVEDQNAEKWSNLLDKITSGSTDSQLIKFRGIFFSSEIIFGKNVLSL